MVTAAYMTEQPRAPGQLKRVFDQQAIPAAMNLVGRVELGVSALAGAAQRQPPAALLLAAACGYLLAALLRRR